MLASRLSDPAWTAPATRALRLEAPHVEADASESALDQLTGLPGRRALQARLERACARGEAFGLLLAGLDRFGPLNDARSHGLGDAVLVAVAQRLAAQLPLDAFGARTGGDRFAVLMPLGAHGAAGATTLADALLVAFAAPLHVQGHELRLSASVGIVLAPEHAHAPAELRRYAELAMDGAKRAGGGTWQLHTPAAVAAVEQRFALEQALRVALERDEYCLHWQPRYAVAGGAMRGAEALLRWRHPQRGLVGPAEFVPLLEETGLIAPVGRWVLEQALAQLATWEAAGLADFVVSVNVSAGQLRDDALVDWLEQVWPALAPRANRLELELTESVLAHDALAVRARLERLRALGVHLSIDDFGSGYSSLAYLKRFAPDVLKIDRALVRHIDVSDTDRAIVHAAIELAHALAVRVVAEGVEREDQLAVLAAAGCQEFQGFLRARPLPAAELETLAQWPAACNGRPGPSPPTPAVAAPRPALSDPPAAAAPTGLPAPGLSVCSAAAMPALASPHFARLLTFGCRAALAAHTVFLVAFAAMGQALLAAANVASVALYAVCLGALARGRTRLALALTWLEVVAHSALATRQLGWASGFHYYLLVLLGLTFVHTRRDGRAAQSIAVAVALWGLYAVLDLVDSSRADASVALAPASLALLRHANLAGTFALLAAIWYYFIASVGQAEQRLRTLAETDALTGLANRRRGVEVLEAILNGGGPACVILADIDHFKHLNDAWGHPEGDRAICHVAQRLRAACRASDLVARWGGEEFLLLLPGATLAEAGAIARRIHEALGATPLPVGKARVPLTVTLGVAARGAGDTVTEWMTRADNALYAGKRRGRHCTEVADGPQET